MRTTPEQRAELARAWAHNQGVLDLLADLAELEAERDEARRERDLAIAHDRQPYPTAEAYELACKHRDEARAERSALSARVAELEATLAHRDEYMAAFHKCEAALSAARARVERLEAALRGLAYTSSDHPGELCWCDREGTGFDDIEPQRHMQKCQRARAALEGTT